MKKKFFAYMIIGILLFTFLAQGKGTKTYWFQIASQGEGESGFLTNDILCRRKRNGTCQENVSKNRVRRSYIGNAFLQS